MILLDTSFVVSYLNTTDQNHARAVEIQRHLDSGEYGAQAITDFIFDEIMTVMLGKLKDAKRTSLEGDKLLNLQLFKIDATAFAHAREIFKNQEGHKLSFTDCSTIAVSEMHAISALASFDAEFKKVSHLKVID